MRKLMQLSRNDERQEEEDRDANGQRIVGLYGVLPIVFGMREWRDWVQIIRMSLQL
jgi:hypothetical protein